ncbi:hypothetical protein NDU88_009052 [Pleurodeles waltl]|uniref:Uncharacterized protein n=1 Tax=Pleurodeles waltl TaxID=8319 RepID=A0AAV7PTV3_PLEWA|nr:hypothetical protein NDU88_009052 [Pleurodeles waltl]
MGRGLAMYYDGRLSAELRRAAGLGPGKVPPAEQHLLPPLSNMADAKQSATMDRILQEVLAVGRKLEGMDSAMASLMAETKSMRLDIAGFQSQVTRLDQTTKTSYAAFSETRINSKPEKHDLTPDAKAGAQVPAQHIHKLCFIGGCGELTKPVPCIVQESHPLCASDCAVSSWQEQKPVFLLLCRP